MKRTAFAMILLAAGGLSDAAAAVGENLVVMVEARLNEASIRERGAGIIVDESPERTVIVTALHVVESVDGDKASEISVEFASRRGQTFKATTDGFYADPTLDLAVLFVARGPDNDSPRILDQSNRNAISPSLPTSLAGASVEKSRLASLANTGSDLSALLAMSSIDAQTFSFVIIYASPL